MCFFSFITAGDDRQLKDEMEGKNMKCSKALGRSQEKELEKN